NARSRADGDMTIAEVRRRGSAPTGCHPNGGRDLPPGGVAWRSWWPHHHAPGSWPDDKSRPRSTAWGEKSGPAAFVTRFAPSPTGYLHKGHAFSALSAFEAARTARG